MKINVSSGRHAPHNPQLPLRARMTNMKLARLLGAFIVFASFGSQSGVLAAQALSTGSTAETFGRRIFQGRCAMCHVGADPATEVAAGRAAVRPTFGPLLSKANAANDAA